LTIDQVKAGLERLSNGENANKNLECWPPNLPEFVMLCKKVDEEANLQIEYYKHPNRSRSIRKEDALRFAELKKKLGCRKNSKG
jgi:hypothetical protein